MCPVECLRVYKQKTATFCDNPKENFPFQSFIGKHGPFTSSTVVRWLKTCLQKAVDASKFQALSTRATKAAMSGITVGVPEDHVTQ